MRHPADDLPRRVLKIGITGHQEREGIDWSWVRSCIERNLDCKIALIGFSSLASGTDQIFAEAVLNCGGKLTAVIPIKNYVSYFESEALERYLRLLALADVVELGSARRDEWAFLDAGKWIARTVDQIIAVWDGEEAGGVGGTGDIVAYSISLNKPVVHLNPITRTITHL